MSRIFLTALVAAMLACSSVLPGQGLAQVEAPDRQEELNTGRTVPVIVARAAEAQNVAEVEVIGSGLALRSVVLYPAAAGEVVEVAFKAGQRVRAGQVLLRLEDRRQRLAVDMAAARLDTTRRLLARYENTSGSGAVAGSAIDQARSDHRQAEIALAQAREALADRSLRAPFDGVVGLPEVQRGDRIGLDTVVTTLDDRSRIRVAFSVPELYLGRLEIGHGVAVTSVAYPERRFEGRISRLDSRVDPVTRRVRVEAEVKNVDDLLRPGMSFNVDLALAGGRAMAVPELSLQWDRQGPHVWVVRAHRAVRVGVRMIRRLHARVLVDGALRAGEPVVVEGVQRMHAGRRVEVIGWDDPVAKESAR